MENEKKDLTAETAATAQAQLLLHKDLPVRCGYLTGKRIFDFTASLLGLIVLIVPMAIIGAIIYIDDPHGNPIFHQIRVGHKGKKFKFYKFRSMYVDAEERLEELLPENEMEGPAFKIKDDPRITRVGKFIRRSGLDELPQLINILRGDMSVVGPRPPLPREVEQYTPYQMQRLSVKPGLTCLWQIAPRRNDLTFDQWMELDLEYITNRCFKLDVEIIFKTAMTVIRATGE